LAVPVCASAQCLVKYLLDRRLLRRGMPLDAAAYVEREKQQQKEAAQEEEEN